MPKFWKISVLDDIGPIMEPKITWTQPTEILISPS